MEAYLSHLDDDSIHVTFNGSMFDVPFIKNRCAYYRMNPHRICSILIYCICKKSVEKILLPNCQLQTIEKKSLNWKKRWCLQASTFRDIIKHILDWKEYRPIVPNYRTQQTWQDIVSWPAFWWKCMI